MPMIVPIASKKVDSSTVKTKRMPVSAPTLPKPPKRLTLPTRPKSGVATGLPGHFGVVRPQDGTFATALMITATMMFTIEMRMAPGTLRTISASVKQRAEDEDQDGPAVEVTVGAELERDGGLGDVRDARDEARVDQADQHDEQADTDRDALAQAQRHGVHDALAQTGRDKEHHDEAREDDHAHGVRPGHPRGELQGDDRVHAEARRQRDRHVADDAHEQRGEGRGQGGRGDQLAVVQVVPVHVLRAAQDDRVQHDDVGHREEGGETAADLAGQGAAALGDLEVAVQRALRGAGSRLVRGGGLGGGRGGHG